MLAGDENYGQGPHVVLIEYCGGWGFRNRAFQVYAQMNKVFGNQQFTYRILRDMAKTGRLEVTVNNQLVHSKAATGDYPNSNW